MDIPKYNPYSSINPLIGSSIKTVTLITSALPKDFVLPSIKLHSQIEIFPEEVCDKEGERNCFSPFISKFCRSSMRKDETLVTNTVSETDSSFYLIKPTLCDLKLPYEKFIVKENVSVFPSHIPFYLKDKRFQSIPSKACRRRKRDYSGKSKTKCTIFESNHTRYGLNFHTMLDILNPYFKYYRQSRHHPWMIFIKKSSYKEKMASSRSNSSSNGTVSFPCKTIFLPKGKMNLIICSVRSFVGTVGYKNNWNTFSLTNKNHSSSLLTKSNLHRLDHAKNRAEQFRKQSSFVSYINIATDLIFRGCRMKRNVEQNYIYKGFLSRRVISSDILIRRTESVINYQARNGKKKIGKESFVDLVLTSFHSYLVKQMMSSGKCAAGLKTRPSSFLLRTISHPRQNSSHFRRQTNCERRKKSSKDTFVPNYKKLKMFIAHESLLNNNENRNNEFELLSKQRETVNNLLVNIKGEFLHLLSKSREIEIEENGARLNLRHPKRDFLHNNTSISDTKTSKQDIDKMRKNKKRKKKEKKKRSRRKKTKYNESKLNPVIKPMKDIRIISPLLNIGIGQITIQSSTKKNNNVTLLPSNDYYTEILPECMKQNCNKDNWNREGVSLNNNISSSRKSQSNLSINRSLKSEERNGHVSKNVDSDECLSFEAIKKNMKNSGNKNLEKDHFDSIEQFSNIKENGIKKISITDDSFTRDFELDTIQPNFTEDKNVPKQGIADGESQQTHEREKRTISVDFANYSMEQISILCSETFLEKSSEAAAELSSGRWTKYFFAGENIPEGIKIMMYDYPLIDESLVDIELQNGIAIKVVYLSCWDNTSLKKFVHLLSTGRYNKGVHFLIVSDTNQIESTTQIIVLQNALVKQSGCPNQNCTFHFVAKRSLSGSIAKIILHHRKENNFFEDSWLEKFTSNIFINRIRLLLSIVPSLSVYDALKSYQNNCNQSETSTFSSFLSQNLLPQGINKHQLLIALNSHLKHQHS